MLTDDYRRTADALGAQVGIDTVYSGLRPGANAARKPEIVRGRAIATVGYGVNDAPALGVRWGSAE